MYSADNSLGARSADPEPVINCAHPAAASKQHAPANRLIAPPATIPKMSLLMNRVSLITVLPAQIAGFAVTRSVIRNLTVLNRMS